MKAEAAEEEEVVDSRKALFIRRALVRHCSLSFLLLCQDSSRNPTIYIILVDMFAWLSIAIRSQPSVLMFWLYMHLAKGVAFEQTPYAVRNLLNPPSPEVKAFCLDHTLSCVDMNHLLCLLHHRCSKHTLSNTCTYMLRQIWDVHGYTYSIILILALQHTNRPNPDSTCPSTPAMNWFDACHKNNYYLSSSYAKIHISNLNFIERA